jgi:hypothetical protein
VPGWIFWLALAVTLAALIASLAFVGVRGLALWRQLRATGGDLLREVDRVTTSAEVLASQTESMAGATEQLDAALARLAVSRARLMVLLEAGGEVRSSLARVTGYVPREKEA